MPSGAKSFLSAAAMWPAASPLSWSGGIASMPCCAILPGRRLARRRATPVAGDLDRAAGLARLAGLSDVVLHLAPPPTGARPTPVPATWWRPGKGAKVHHAALSRAMSGVYGDCGGASSTRPAASIPRAPGPGRRVDAEVVRRFARRTGWAGDSARPGNLCRRAPAGRAPAAGTPAPAASDDPYTNHIHADDLAAASSPPGEVAAPTAFTTRSTTATSPWRVFRPRRRRLRLCLPPPSGADRGPSGSRRCRCPRSCANRGASATGARWAN